MELQFKNETHDEWQQLVVNNTLETGEERWIALSIYVSFNLVLKHPTKPWYWDVFSGREDVPYELILKFPDKSWNWYRLSIYCKNVFSLVEKFPTKPWAWDELVRRSDVTFDFIVKHMDYINWNSLPIRHPPTDFTNSRIDRKMQNLLLFTIYEQFEIENKRSEICVEQVLMTNCLVNLIANY
jgi:hypothetical protein